jgi:hypothetical protein
MMYRFDARGEAGRRTGSRELVPGIVLAIALAMLLAGCATSGRPVMRENAGAPTGSGSQMAGQMGTMTAAAGAPDANAQVCADCAGGTMAPTVDGAAVMDGGKQVLRITVNDGHYEPNRIAVKAGVPLTVIFTGKAKGCLAKPVFPELGKKADFTSGTATVDVGAIPAGTYTFTCAMKMSGATITAH